MADFESIRARIRLSQAKSLARTMISVKSDAADIEAACSLAAEQFPDIAPALLAEEIRAEQARAWANANDTIAAFQINARAEQAYTTLTGQRL